MYSPKTESKSIGDALSAMCGSLAKFDDGKPDYLSRLRQSFKDGSPLIESLADLVCPENAKRKIVISFNPENENDCFCEPKNCGYFLLDALYDAHISRRSY